MPSDVIIEHNEESESEACGSFAICPLPASEPESESEACGSSRNLASNALPKLLLKNTLEAYDSVLESCFRFLIFLKISLLRFHMIPLPRIRFRFYVT
ncbi:hypothetical protein Bca4012_037787 [Brassica carinata]